jgi:hypothetical protein
MDGVLSCPHCSKRRAPLRFRVHLLRDPRTTVHGGQARRAGACVLGEEAVDRIAQHHDDPRVREPRPDGARRPARSQIVATDFANRALVAHVFEQLSVLFPLQRDSGSPLVAHRPFEVSLQRRGVGVEAHARLRREVDDLRRKETRLLDGAHINRPVLVEVVVERCRSGLRCADDEEIWKEAIQRVRELAG